MTPDIILQRTGIDVRAVEQGDDAWHKLRLEPPRVSWRVFYL